MEKTQGRVLFTLPEHNQKYPRSPFIFVNVPSISFITESGKTFTFKDCNGCNPDLKVGDTVRVAYNKKNPKDAYVDNGSIPSELMGYSIAFGSGLLLIFFIAYKKIILRSKFTSTSNRR